MAREDVGLYRRRTRRQMYAIRAGSPCATCGLPLNGQNLQSLHRACVARAQRRRLSLSDRGGCPVPVAVLIDRDRDRDRDPAGRGPAAPFQEERTRTIRERAP